jgi:hypothetical protein
MRGEMPSRENLGIGGPGADLGVETMKQ